MVISYTDFSWFSYDIFFMLRAYNSQQKGYFNDISKFLWILDCIEISCGRCGANLKSETSPAQSWMYMRTTFKLTTTKWAVKFCQSRQRFYWNDNLLWEKKWYMKMIWMVLLMTVMSFQEFQFDLKLQADLIWTSSDLRQLSIWFVKVSTTAEWWWWW